MRRGPRWTGGTRVYPPLCTGAWSHVTSNSHGAPVSLPGPEGPEGLGCIRRCVGVRGAMSLQTPTGRPYPSPARRDRRDSGVAAAVWGCVEPCRFKPPRGIPIPSRPGGTGGTQVYPPLCGGAWSHVASNPHGAPLSLPGPEGPEGLGCIRRCVGVRGAMSLQTPTGRPYPFPARRDRRDSGVSAAVWGCVEPCRFKPPRGTPIPSRPGGTGGTRVYPPLCGGERKGTVHTLAPPEAHPSPEGPAGLRGTGSFAGESPPPSAAACGRQTPPVVGPRAGSSGPKTVLTPRTTSCPRGCPPMSPPFPLAEACGLLTPPVVGPRAGSSGPKTVLTPRTTSCPRGCLRCLLHLPRRRPAACGHPLLWGHGLGHPVSWPY